MYELMCAVDQDRFALTAGIAFTPRGRMGVPVPSPPLIEKLAFCAMLNLRIARSRASLYLPQPPCHVLVQQTRNQVW